MIKVLYVDDEPDLLELSRIFLERSGSLSVDTAGSAAEALQKLKYAPCNVIVADYQMPEMDGIELLKKVRASIGNIPFILFTGKGREEVVIEALNNGADFYLQKGGEPVSQYTELEHKINLAAERQRSEKKIIFFNQLYALLSEINAAIVRIKSQADFFSEVCQAAVDRGKFRMAWIGLIDPGSREIYPVAGSDIPGGYSGIARLSLDPGPDNQNPGEQAVRERQPVTCNDFNAGQKNELWYSCAVSQGLRSTAVFPLFLRDEVIGIFQIYSDEAGFFAKDELNLLNEVAVVISSGIKNLNEKMKRQTTEKSLIESEEKFRILSEESLVGVYIIRNNRLIYANPKFAEIFGYQRDEMPPDLQVLDLIAPTDQKHILSSITLRDSAAGSRKSFYHVFSGIRKDGSRIDLETTGTTTLYHGKPVIIGMLKDITHRKRAESELLEKNLQLEQAYRKLSESAHEMQVYDATLTRRQDELTQSQRLVSGIIEFLPDATFVLDRNGRVIVWNRAMETMTGIPAEKMIGSDGYAHAIPFYGTARPLLADLALHWEESGAQKYRRIKRDGDHIMSTAFIPSMNSGKGSHLWFIASPLYDRQGQIMGAIESIRDITSFIEVQQTLEVSGKKLLEANQRITRLDHINRHEIADRLTVLRGQLRLIKKNAEDPACSLHAVKADNAARDIYVHLKKVQIFHEIGARNPVWQNAGTAIRKEGSSSGNYSIVLADETKNLEVYADPLFPQVFFILLEHALRDAVLPVSVRISVQGSGADLLLAWEDTSNKNYPLDRDLFNPEYGKTHGPGLFPIREILAVTGITLMRTELPGNGFRAEMRVPPNAFRYPAEGPESCTGSSVPG
jgi:PAS domain S-box-containing protein